MLQGRQGQGLTWQQFQPQRVVTFNYQLLYGNPQETNPKGLEVNGKSRARWEEMLHPD